MGTSSQDVVGDVPAAPSADLPGWGSRRPAGATSAEPGADELADVFETRMRAVQDALERHGDLDVVAQLEEALEAKVLAEERASHAMRRRLAALVGLQDALGGLRRATSSSSILEVAPKELVRACDVDRANLFRVHDGRMVMEAAYWEGDPRGAEEMLAYARSAAPRLDHMLLETEMIRRRAPCLVVDAPSDPRVPRGLADFARTRSYVAAPIMPSGKVIGFVHADCLYSGRVCDELDRDLVWAFAEGFGYAFERTVMAERLRRQRDRTRAALLETVELLDDAAEDDLRLTHAEALSDAESRAAAGRLLTPAAPIEALLTRREVEVIRLMATGGTNKAIADELVVTVGTVKAHVKHILRKLGAANRSEAVSRYLRSASELDLRALEARGSDRA
ncbi:LuxR C-terminal-related transcriptional regulator [Patulibacter minatonensis]|uniref:LuxR C-terminal-related transcriptional regulator n=1 Tax=Patulibacter minatonensis TaxID=298163 RepID=UPI00068714A7|nr:LuxR C-terminal-related transcriptional regulator [Patulibacter minatonensis]